jgi:uncharacterized protein (DUF983 family)
VPQPESNSYSETASPAGAGLRGKCPRCGEGPLFRNGLMLRERCTTCDLDYGFIDTGDGPAVFAILLLGAIVLGAALYAEFKYNVSVLFHIIAWGLITPLLAFAFLRWLKGLLIGLQFQNKAEEGRLKRD